MAKTYAMTVDVPEFDEKAAYDHDRPISSLIRTQLLHLTAAENLALPRKFQTGVNINTLHTERQASAYIQRVTALLHKHGKAEARKAAGGATKATRKSARRSAKPSAKKSAKRSVKESAKASRITRKPRPAAKTGKSFQTRTSVKSRT